MKISHVRGIYMRNSLPKAPRNLEKGILNLDIVAGTGTHWTAWYKYENICFYFDSFGLMFPKEFKKYMKDCDIIWSAYKIQNIGEVICGHLCLEVLKRLEYEKFDHILIDIFSRKKKNI